MRTAKSVRAALTLLGALGAVGGASYAVLAGPPPPSYSLSIPSQTVDQPATSASPPAVADFPVTIIAGAGGYTSPVALTFKGLPPGVTADWDQETSPGSKTAIVAVSSGTYDPTRDLLLSVPYSLKVGTYDFTIHSVNAINGKDAHDTKATLGVGAPVSASNNFSLGVNPGSRIIQQGQQTTFTVTLNLPSGYTGGAVKLTAGGLPGGATGAFSPTSLSTQGQQSTLTITTTDKTKAGQFHVKITGTSGKTHQDVTVTLTVQSTGKNAGFTLAVSPTQQQIAAGGTTSFAVGISRNNFSGSVTLDVTGLPTQASASWDVTFPYAGDTATLTVTTDEVYTPDGNFNLTITGTAVGNVVPSQTVVAKLVVKTPSGKAVGISGNALNGLTDGGPASPINLQLANPNDKPIWITNITVSISGTSNPLCDVSNFTVTQYSGGYPLTVAKKATSTLASLGVAQTQWPTVAMVSSSGTQDDCRDMTVNLHYTASAREAG